MGVLSQLQLNHLVVKWLAFIFHLCRFWGNVHGLVLNACARISTCSLRNHLLPKMIAASKLLAYSSRQTISHLAAAIGDGKGKKTLVRKNVNVLTDEEVYALRQAMGRFQNDTSVDGFQAVAEYHGLPAKCPHPDAAVRYACCIHGMATFPHWHRLFVVEVSAIPLVIFCLFYFINVLSHRALSHESGVAFSGESQLRQSRATQPAVHVGCFSVFIIHRSLDYRIFNVHTNVITCGCTRGGGRGVRTL